MEIFIAPRLHVHYSVQILSFYLRIWMEVDKYFKTFIWKSFFGNPLYVPGNCQTIYKLNIHNYLILKF